MLARHCFAGKVFSGLFEAIASSIELEQVAVVHQAIEDSRSHGVVPEICPSVEAGHTDVFALRRDHCATG